MGVKHFLLTNLFKVPVIKAWYVGREYLKNPPIVKTSGTNKIENLHFTNTTLNIEKAVVVQNCKFISTLKYIQYIT